MRIKNIAILSLMILSISGCSNRQPKLVIQENPTGQYDHLALLKVSKSGTSFKRDGYFEDYAEMPYFLNIGDVYFRYREDLEFISIKENIYTAEFGDHSFIKIYRLQDDKIYSNSENIDEPLIFFDEMIAQDFGYAKTKYQYEMVEPKMNDTGVYIEKSVGKLAFYDDIEMTSVGDHYTYVAVCFQSNVDSNVYMVIGLDGTGFDTDLDELTDIVDAMGMGVSYDVPVRPERVSESSES